MSVVDRFPDLFLYIINGLLLLIQINGFVDIMFDIIHGILYLAHTPSEAPGKIRDLFGTKKNSANKKITSNSPPPRLLRNKSVIGHANL